MPEAWAGADEATRHLDVAKDTIYCWIEMRGLPAHRVGRQWQFKLSKVDACIKRGGAGEEPYRGGPPTKGGRT